MVDMIANRSLLGASVSRPKALGIRHRGTCADHSCCIVVDTQPETGARIVFLPEFLAGFNGSVDSVGLTPAEQQMRALRAIYQIGRLPYQQANCDVLATYAETGTAWSPQAVGILAFACAAGLFIWASRN
jgi:hypothetical protein